MRELLERCLAGEEDAIAVLVGRFQTKALDLAAALLQDAHLAEDAVQQAFMTALRRLGELREPDAFAGWFRQIVRTECTNIRRRRKEQPDAGGLEEPVSDCDSPGVQTQREELRRLVRRAIDSLPVTHRQTSQLFYIEERTCAEIGTELGIPEGTVKRRLHEGRERLRAMLLGYVGEASGDGERRDGVGWVPFL